MEFFGGQEHLEGAGFADQARETLGASPSGDEAERGAAMAEEAGDKQFDLFYSLVSWLRERPTGIGSEPKKQLVYEVDPANINTNPNRTERG